MNIVTEINDFNTNNIYFNEPIQNTVIDDSYFIKLIYSNIEMVLNSIYLLIPLNIQSKEIYYKKNKLNFDINNNNNKNIINIIKQIEVAILKKYNKTKHIKSQLFDSLSNGNIKSFINEHNTNTTNTYVIILKISGIWENENEIGLTYKFLIS